MAIDKKFPGKIDRLLDKLTEVRRMPTDFPALHRTLRRYITQDPGKTLYRSHSVQQPDLLLLEGPRAGVIGHPGELLGRYAVVGQGHAGSPSQALEHPISHD